MLPNLTKIIQKKGLVLWGDFSDQDLLFLKDNLASQNLCLQMNVESAEKA